MVRISKPKSFYKKEFKNLIKLVSKKHPEILEWISVDRYCNDVVYRKRIKYRLLNIEKIKLYWKKRRDNHKEYCIEKSREWDINNRERRREIAQKYRSTHKRVIRSGFDTWVINNPKKAMLCAATGKMAQTIINRLWIRPTVCPHCGRSNCLIDFHHPNHLFWWKWTFCCKSCHYFFNRDKVPASDTIIDLKKLLRESNSH